jgi:hypothetical protein
VNFLRSAHLLPSFKLRDVRAGKRGCLAFELSGAVGAGIRYLLGSRVLKKQPTAQGEERCAQVLMSRDVISKEQFGNVSNTIPHSLSKPPRRGLKNPIDNLYCEGYLPGVFTSRAGAGQQD